MRARSAQCNLALRKGNCTAIRIGPWVHVKVMDVLLVKKTLTISAVIHTSDDGDARS